AWISSPAGATGVVVRAPRMVTVVPTLREVPHEPGAPPREATAYLLALPHGALLLPRCSVLVGATNTTAQTVHTVLRRRGNFRGRFRPRDARRAPVGAAVRAFRRRGRQSLPRAACGPGARRRP